MSFSYQLYSSRNFPPLTNTIKLVGELGYSEVEGYGGLFGDMAAVKALKADLDANGLKMGSTHIGLDMVEDDIATASVGGGWKAHRRCRLQFWLPQS